jgi:PAS domain S-box-containing protein
MATSHTGLDPRDVVRLFDRIAALAGAGGGTDQCLARALDLVCDFTGWPLGHVYLFDPDTATLRPTGIWHGGDAERVSAFVQATSRSPLAAGAGLPGQAYSAGRTLWSADLHGDPRQAAAIASGVGAALASPIVSPRQIEGIIELFPQQSARPEELLLDVLSHIGRDVGGAVELARQRDEIGTAQAWLAIAERLGRMGTWRYHVDRDLVHWSEELFAIHGADPTGPPSLDEYLSKVHRDDAEHVGREIRRAIESQQGFDVEYRLVLPSHEVRWAHACGEFLPTSSSGQEPILVGYCQDITEQKRRLEALQRGREQLAEAERQAHLGSWSWDVTTGAVVVSDELVRIVGLEPGAAAPADVGSYLGRVHPDDEEAVRATLASTIAHGKPFHQEVRLLRPDGSLRWIVSHGEVAEQADGVVIRLAGFTQDITERRLAEEERARLERMLHQSQRLESLGQLAGGVAHDFNNLLSAILSYASFVGTELASMAADSTDPRHGELLADVMQISRAARRAAELTRRLLVFGRREVVRPVVLVLNDVVRDVEQLLRRSLGAHIELEILLEPDLWAVHADAGQLEQVLVNLAVNARDAMPGGGTLTIETANVHLDRESAPSWPALPPGRYVRLRVSDNGFGMTRHVADRAFEPFFTTKEKGEGSGLGLATVHGIIAQAGGGARIDSVPGAGTVITCVWPATDMTATEEAPAPDDLAQRPASGQVVLVVEDEAPLREATVRMLARNGYVVLSAADGGQAIALTRTHGGPIDLLLTDIIMPRMLGKDVAAVIAALRPGVRVVFMSGYARSSLTSESLQPGVMLLEKPFSETELIRLVRRALEGTERVGQRLPRQ